MAAIYLAEITPELSLDRLLVGTGGLGILYLLVKGFLAHLQKVEERHQKAAQKAQDNFREDMRSMRAEHLEERDAAQAGFLAEREASQAEFRRSLKETFNDLHPRLDKLEEGQEETNKKLDDVGGHLANMNRPKP